MKQEAPCHHRILASGPACRVSLCSHQTVHVEMGTLTLRLRPDQLEAIANTLAAACAEVTDPVRARRQRLLC